MTANQINYLKVKLGEKELAETARHNAEVEAENMRSNKAREAETKRHNKYIELYNQGSLMETTRHNSALERESQRHDLAVEVETERSNQAREFETNRHNAAVEEQARLELGEAQRHNRATEANQALQAQASLMQAGAAQSQAATAARRADIEAERLSIEIPLMQAQKENYEASAKKSQADASVQEAYGYLMYGNSYKSENDRDIDTAVNRAVVNSDFDALREYDTYYLNRLRDDSGLAKAQGTADVRKSNAQADYYSIQKEYYPDTVYAEVFNKYAGGISSITKAAKDVATGAGAIAALFS